MVGRGPDACEDLFEHQLPSRGPLRFRQVRHVAHDTALPFETFADPEDDLGADLVLGIVHALRGGLPMALVRFVLARCSTGFIDRWNY